MLCEKNQDMITSAILVCRTIKIIPVFKGDKLFKKQKSDTGTRNIFLEYDSMFEVTLFLTHLKITLQCLHNSPAPV